MQEKIDAQTATDKSEKMDRYIESARKAWDIPGLAVAIVKDDKIVYAKGFGSRNINTDDPVDADTVFHIASNTKAFTATAIGLLVQEGKLSWDTPVHEVMPDFQLYDPEVTKRITPRDMLCHRSGLGLWAGDLTWWHSNYDRKEVMRRIRFQKPATDFRSAYLYCNLMYLVSGEMIPAVTGQSWDDFLKQRFFEPLNMKRTVISMEDLGGMTNVAQPHAIAKGKLTAIEHFDGDNMAPAGAVKSCVNDLAQWVRLQLNNGKYNGKQIVDPKIIAETRKPHNLIVIGDEAKALNPYTHLSAYCLGWRTHDYRGRLVINHTGGIDGMLSYVGFIPEENVGVILLTNSEIHDLHRALPLYLFDSMLGIEGPDWNQIYLDDFIKNKNREEQEEKQKRANRPKGTKPTLALKEYAGTYTSKIYGKAAITEKNGKLTIVLSAHPENEGTIEHYDRDTFEATWQYEVWKTSLVHFKLNDQGQVTKFLISVRPDWMDTLEYTFVKDK